MALKVSVSGIRGIVGEDLNPENIVTYVAAFLDCVGKPGDTVLIGRDSRSSGMLIERIAGATANALGWHCINIGIVPTPTALLATRRFGCQGGIIVTASHNPVQWNALKLCDSQGLFLQEAQVARIENRVQASEGLLWKGYADLGKSEEAYNASSLHLDTVLGFLDTDAIAKQHFRVVIDPCGATGCVVDRPFLESLGCTVIGINDTLSQEFPRGTEPIPENLVRLASQVKREKANIGFAQDPDADRLAVVSDTGVPIGEEYTLILAGEAYLRRRKTDIAVNLSTSMMVEDLAKRHGVNVFRTKIGEINVTSQLLQKKLGYGGEGNGGVIVPEVNPCRDSLVAMGLILEYLSIERGRMISEIIQEFPSYCMKKYKIKASDGDRGSFYHALYDRAQSSFKGYTIDTVDGIKIFNNEEWLHIRASNTEPAIRIMAESGASSRTDILINEGRHLTSSL
jgi:phosphomannomutase